MEDLYKRVLEILHSGKTFALVHLFSTKGSTPNDSGSKMIVHIDGRTEFTIGGGTFEATVTADAVEAMKKGQSVWKNYTLTKEELKMLCGGTASVFIDVYIPALQLIIFGGGHVGKVVAEMARLTGQFRIAVVDDRPEFSNKEMHPAADETILCESEYTSPFPEFDERSFIVIVTRNHTTDMNVLRKVINVPKVYLGMIGSKKKINEVFAILKEEGISQELLKQIHAPIGLPLGGKSPGEIAVSIMAEILQVKKEKGL
ncbi:MAG: hypothetical protein A2Y62_10025 [Candidatus Fischerbacteria bacterium RBG_13_37_8]|uniref:Xanthine dehydrogenase n=1 Tax=Candidatus Fischerbacteria bacterium RBG_13_37_8 TaxID=1817863 RepID=A0A1F5V608_9BACT|nr:MAG: hypothetical protein A2Y62_10025 [Candidatus Fischerbacteria bacterium RBG_13_37_8]